MKLQKNKLLSMFIILSLVLSLSINVYGADTSAPDGEGGGAYAVAAPSLDIKSVEVVTGGNLQVLYRPQVYRGIAANGEDPAKFYTTRREINLSDSRIFNVEFFVPVASVTDPQAFLNTVDFTYDGFALNRWGNGTNLRGTTAIMSLSNKAIATVEGGYKVSASVRVNTPYATGNASAGSNIPYNGYGGGGQTFFGRTDAFTFGPGNKGTGTYALAAVSGSDVLASVDLHIGVYDTFHSFVEINDFAQSLVFAISGEKLDISKKQTGVIAAGTVIKNANGAYVSGDGVFIEVSVGAYTHRGNPIWSIAVAKDGKTIDDYLKPGGFKDQMNNNPQALIDKYKNSAPEDIDFVIPFQMNNVHADEISGTDSMIQVIDDMIDGGKAGKTVSYRTFDNDDISWNYRPSGNTNTGYTAFNHFVQGGLTGRFAQEGTRTQMTINTAEILDKFIMVNSLCSNPDGKELMRRTNKFGEDLNRDTVYMSQPEAKALTAATALWDPIVMLEWHGYVTQILIEPCTAPHCPNYEVDLTLNNMIQLAYYMGKATVGSTGYNRFHLPWDSMASGWDDGGNVYGPMFAMLYGAMGWTIELPHANNDSLDAGNAMIYASLNALLNGETAYYSGNVLNRATPGTDEQDNSVDIKYPSMRKSTIMNKFEFKLRGVENIDAKETVDKYFINVISGVKNPYGRERRDDGKGGKLSFFPDYLVVPSTPEIQWNVAEALKTLEMTQRYGAKIKKSTAPVTYNGITYPAGTYLYDMRQGNRNFVAEIMSKGYDASKFASMYADIYCNYPDTRGFDCYEVWSPGLFNNKAVDIIEPLLKSPSNIVGTPAEYIVFKSNSTDAVRFVNLMLSGKSSGPSVSDGVAPVWMLRKNVEGVGKMSDYVIKASDLYKINYLVDNTNLGLQGCYLEGKYISALPKEAVALVNPVIQLNTTRSADRDGGYCYWALDEYLGFSSMKNANGTDYTGTGTGSIRTGANVFLLNAAAGTAQIRDYVMTSKAGVVTVNNATGLLTQFGYTAPATVSMGDAAFYGDYNVDDSLITANYADTNTLYGRGLTFNTIPAGSKTLFKTYAGTDKDWFIGGYQRSKETGTNFANRTTMFTSLLKSGMTGKPAQHVTFGSNMFYRGHYQKYYPMLATAIFAGAAGILDDQIDPVITNIVVTDTPTMDLKVAITATDANSGIESYSFYQWDAATGAYVLKATQASGSYDYPALSSTAGYRLKVVVKDYAGNETEQIIRPFSVINSVTEAGSGNLKVTSGLFNNQSSAQTCTVILAVYDSKGKLVANKTTALSVAANSNQSVVSELSGLKFGEGWAAKAFVWCDKFIPLAEALDVSLK